jgi:hypothetical protein
MALNKSKTKIKPTKKKAAPKSPPKSAPASPEEAGKKLGPAIDEVHAVDAEIDAAMAKVKIIQDRRAKLVTDLMTQFTALQIQSAKGSKVIAYLSETKHPTVKDWAAVEAYVYKYKAFELFQRRITSTAYFDRIAAGEAIEGVEVFTRIDMKFKANRG